VRYRERPELWDTIGDLFPGVWPEYNVHGEVVASHWGRLSGSSRNTSSPCSARTNRSWRGATAFRWLGTGPTPGSDLASMRLLPAVSLSGQRAGSPRHCPHCQLRYRCATGHWA
jgi:hypothetical protein